MTVESETRIEKAEERTRIPSPVLWYAVLGGVMWWAIQLFFAWSFTEVACLGVGPGLHLQQVPSGFGLTPRLVVYIATGVAWLGAVAALVTTFVVRARLKKYGEDLLARERVGFLVVLGFFLNAMTIAIITGGGIALAVLRPCT
jgi:hypothetical protein